MDDGSRDESWEVHQKDQGGAPGKRQLPSGWQRTSASTAPLSAVFNFAKGNYIITLDDDLQCPPEEIPKLIKAMEESDAELVYGIYKNKKHSFYRNLGSKSLKNMSGILGKPKEGSSFRLISKNIISKDHNPSPEFRFYR